MININCEVSSQLQGTESYPEKSHEARKKGVSLKVIFIYFVFVGIIQLNLIVYIPRRRFDQDLIRQGNTGDALIFWQEFLNKKRLQVNVYNLLLHWFLY